MLLIFANLCKVQDFAACEGVCRAWRRLLPDCRPHAIIASRQQPLQQLIWLAAHRTLVRHIKKFGISDDVTDADVELSNLLHLAFKYARGLTCLLLDMPVRDNSCSVQNVCLQSSQGQCT